MQLAVLFQDFFLNTSMVSVIRQDPCSPPSGPFAMKAALLLSPPVDFTHVRVQHGRSGQKSRVYPMMSRLKIQGQARGGMRYCQAVVT